MTYVLKEGDHSEDLGADGIRYGNLEVWGVTAVICNPNRRGKLFLAQKSE